MTMRSVSKAGLPLVLLAIVGPARAADLAALAQTSANDKQAALVTIGNPR